VTSRPPDVAPLRIVIVGGGFAGVQCARLLRRRLSAERAEIVIFNRENHMVFHPLLAEVAGGSINPEAVAAPLRQVLPGVRCRTETVQDVDFVGRVVRYEGHDGQIRTMPYDHVVIACGEAVDLALMPGMADHAFPMKTVGDAMALRVHLMQQLERAEVCDDPERRRWYLSFIVVGGGYSGVETAGEINDLVRGSRRFFQNVADGDIRVTLIHSRDQLLPEISPALREFTRVKMEAAGITMVLKARVALATPDGVRLKDGRAIAGATVVCTIGSTMSPVVKHMSAPKEGGRVLAEPDMRIQGFTDAWAVGDCARIVNALDGQVCPPTGQFAERQGRQVAENILSALEGRPTEPFRFKPRGQLCAIGGHTAVAEIFGVRLSGLLAWLAWRNIYLFKLPTWSRRFKVGFDWLWQLVFARDLTHVRTEQTERVSRAFYAAGDYIFRQGDPATNFYIVDRGEVEVIRQPDGGEPPVLLTVRGPGDFFGEMAFIDNRPRNASVRARTAAELTVMGRDAFTRVSSSLAPLRDVLLSAVKERARNVWEGMPDVRQALDRRPISMVLEPAPATRLAPDATLEDALHLFEEQPLDFACVVDDGGVLEGLVTWPDLFRVMEGGAGRVTPVREFMSATPLLLTLDDSCRAATETLRERGLRALPVVDRAGGRRLVGCVRAARILSLAVRETGMAPAPAGRIEGGSSQ
jgi:NADH:ubiquinone reductase (H+-translocating)